MQDVDCEWWIHVARAVHRTAESCIIVFILFSHGRYVSLVRWLWLSRPIWDDSFLHLQHTRSDQMCDWNGINLCWERFSPLLCWETVYCLVQQSGREFLFFFSFLFCFFPPFQAQSKRSIRSCDLKFPSFKVSGARRGWLGAVQGAIRYNFGLELYIFPERERKQTFAWVWLHPRGFFITFLSLCVREGTIKYAQVCAA